MLLLVASRVVRPSLHLLSRTVCCPPSGLPCRKLQLSWLLLWSLLLGTDDLRSGQELASVMLCRRPSVADMAQVAARLSSIATAVEVSGECPWCMPQRCRPVADLIWGTPSPLPHLTMLCPPAGLLLHRSWEAA